MAPTDALLFGRAFHSANLTPKAFEDDYRVFNGDRRTSAGKADYAAMVQQHGENILTQGDLETILAMRLSAHLNPSAKALLTADGDTEVSILWNCEGARAKARIDKYLPVDGTLVDLKTTRNASPGAFSKSIYQYGYHRQAAFYLYAARTMGLLAKRFLFVAIEKEAPYGVAVYELTDEALDAGLREALGLIEIYKECLATGRWPSYGSEIISVDIPNWAYEEAGDEE